MGKDAFRGFPALSGNVFFVLMTTTYVSAMLVLLLGAGLVLDVGGMG